MYKYSFEWFVKVFKVSIENSNKSKNMEKRLRYLKDHLTYSLFCQVRLSAFVLTNLVLHT
jgi:dynein heavy chain